MLNQFVLVGRVTKIEQEEVNIAVPRNYKNSEGVYDTDFITIIVKESINEQMQTYCQKGDLIGVKGRIACLNNNLELVAEKITFLASKKKEEKAREE